jgi:hypothetical protein
MPSRQKTKTTTNYNKLNPLKLKMRKSFFVAAILLSATAVKAQKSVPFKLKFLPNHTYTVTGNTGIVSHVSSADNRDKTSKTPKKRSMDNNAAFFMTYVIKTGAPVAGGGFPYLFTVTDFSSKNEVNGVADKATGKNPVIGAKSAGNCTADGKMLIQSLSFPNADQKTSRALLNMTVKFSDEIEFPKKPMQVGEKFTQVKPFNFGNGTKDIGVKTTVVYTLKSIKGNLAYFDTKETIVSDAKSKKMLNNGKVTTTGNGRGTMVYDIANGFAIAKDDNFDTKLNMSMGPSNMTADAKSIVNYKAQISAN